MLLEVGLAVYSVDPPRPGLSSNASPAGLLATFPYYWIKLAHAMGRGAQRSLLEVLAQITQTIFNELQRDRPWLETSRFAVEPAVGAARPVFDCHAQLKRDRAGPFVTTTIRSPLRKDAELELAAAISAMYYFNLLATNGPDQEAMFRGLLYVCDELCAASSAVGAHVSGIALPHLRTLPSQALGQALARMEADPLVFEHSAAVAGALS